MKNILEPNDMINPYILSSLDNMDVNKGVDYTVIHIRCGDNVLINKCKIMHCLKEFIVV